MLLISLLITTRTVLSPRPPAANSMIMISVQKIITYSHQIIKLFWELTNRVVLFLTGGQMKNLPTKTKVKLVISVVKKTVKPLKSAAMFYRYNHQTRKALSLWILLATIAVIQKLSPIPKDCGLLKKYKFSILDPCWLTYNPRLSHYHSSWFFSLFLKTVAV